MKQKEKRVNLKKEILKRNKPCIPGDKVDPDLDLAPGKRADPGTQLAGIRSLE